MVRARAQAASGQLPSYIPRLAQADPAWFAVQVQRLDGQSYQVGEVRRSFALMSAIKPFLLLFLLEHFGAEVVFKRVGMQPSDQPFHSLTQLMADRGFPRNPMLNSGALVLADLLPGETGSDRAQLLCDWLNHQAGCRLSLDEAMLASVRSLRNEANRAIANLLAETGAIAALEPTIDTYNQICCLSGNVGDLVRLGILLVKPDSPIAPAHACIVNALMLTCGLYEASGTYAVQVGIPIKSGVSGALLAVVPGEGAIACYGPTLDAAGNSIAGLFLLEQMAQTLNLSVFR